MSDKTQSEYTEYMNHIQPSEEFLSRLTQTLESEPPRQGRRRLSRLVPAAAACLILLCLSAAALTRLRPEHTETGDPILSEEMGNYAAPGELLQTTPFPVSDWRDGVSLEEGTPAALAQKLALSLDYLSCSSENRFVGAETADADELARVMALLRDAEAAGGALSGQRHYYMAVFTDGTVAKFSITDEGFIEIAGEETIYQKSEK